MLCLLAEKQSQREGGSRLNKVGDKGDDAAAAERLRERVRAGRRTAEDGGSRRLAVIAAPYPLA